MNSHTPHATTLGVDLDTVYHVKIAGEWHLVVPDTWQIGEGVSFGNMLGSYTVSSGVTEEFRIPWFRVEEQGEDPMDGILTGPLSAIQAMRTNEPRFWERKQGRE